MAAAMGNGTSFFGLPTKESRVLYLEVDTPEASIVKRLKLFSPPPQNVWWLFSSPLSVPNVDAAQHETLQRASEDIKPDVVFVNTLRKVHDMDDKESRTPKLVYSYFQKLFPSSALVFVHHMRKKPVDPKALAHHKEGFSGAMNWLNDAQVGLHLEPFKSEGTNLRLYHRKSQVSDTIKPLPLLLGKDGTHLSSPLYDALATAYECLHEYDGYPATAIDSIIAGKIQMSVSSAKKYRLAVERGDFPGTRKFMETEGLDEEAFGPN
jgi:hypothetical protein